jgi:hypothetical protein
MNLFRFDQTNCKIQTDHLWTERRATANSTFAIGGVSYSADSFVVAESSVLRTGICAKKPAHRKSAKRYGQAFDNTYEKILNKRMDY